MKETTYYYLRRKSDGKIFYVGKYSGDRAKKRLGEHINQAKRENSPKDIFIRDCNYEIEIMPFETYTHKPYCFYASYREKYWIQTFQQLGHTLLNNTLSWMSQYDFKNIPFHNFFLIRQLFN